MSSDNWGSILCVVLTGGLGAEEPDAVSVVLGTLSVEEDRVAFFLMRCAFSLQRGEQ